MYRELWKKVLTLATRRGSKVHGYGKSFFWSFFWGSNLRKSRYVDLLNLFSSLLSALVPWKEKSYEINFFCCTQYRATAFLQFVRVFSPGVWQIGRELGTKEGFSFQICTIKSQVLMRPVL